MSERMPGFLAIGPLALRRAMSRWRLLVPLLLGAILAVALLSSTFIYGDSVRQLGLDQTFLGHEREELDLNIVSYYAPTGESAYATIRSEVDTTILRNVSWFVEDSARAMESSTFFINDQAMEGQPIDISPERIASEELREANPWPLPTVLGPPPPDPLPVDQFPSVLRAHVHSVAGATQTQSDVASLLALVAVCASLAGKAVVKVRDGHTEPVNIYGVVVLPPAARKSPVFRLMVAPIEQYEATEAEELMDARPAALEECDVAEQRLDKVRKAVVAGKMSLDDLT
ncbi:MAG: DUF3987 domain-containing protein, partial [Chloroflexi bacterium]|nr:DUF3987 domain-containing protein [Chloroflexota bacterium]